MEPRKLDPKTIARLLTAFDAEPDLTAVTADPRSSPAAIDEAVLFSRYTARSAALHNPSTSAGTLRRIAVDAEDEAWAWVAVAGRTEDGSEEEKAVAGVAAVYEELAWAAREAVGSRMRDEPRR